MVFRASNHILNQIIMFIAMPVNHPSYYFDCRPKLEFFLSNQNISVDIKQIYSFITTLLIIIVKQEMRPVSPIRSTSPLARPKIVFNYPISPLRQKALTTNFPPNIPQYPADRTSRPSLKLRTQPSQYMTKEILCLVCNKHATYKIKEKAYCSSCYITEMKKGTDVELKDKNIPRGSEATSNKQNTRFIQITPFENDSEITIRPVSEESDGQMLNEVNFELAELQKLFGQINVDDYTEEGIRGLYRDKKVKLKLHYEKIKAAIKLSIQKDLSELEKREANSLQCVEKKKQTLATNINRLQKIKQTIDPTEKMITATQKMECRSLFVQYKMQNARIEEERQMVSQLVSELRSHKECQKVQHDSLAVKLTQQAAPVFHKKLLYDPYLYTLVDTNHKKTGCQFSFDQKSQ